MARSCLHLATLSLTLASVLVGCGRGHERTRSNVLLVTLDTTRADHLGCYGHEGKLTPHLDALAAEGTRFDQALATASVTPVSHASILTGLWNQGHGLRVISAGSGFRLPASIPTLATSLKAAGWKTGAVHSSFTVSSHFGLERGFDHFDDFDAPLVERQGVQEWDVGRFQRRSDETTTRALEFIEGQRDPWLLWLHYWDPHDSALLPPEEFEPSGPEPNAQYARELSYMDSQLGRLFDSLRSSGAWQDTVVVVVADHGEGLGDHGWQHHRLVYQEQLRVPLIVRLPGVAQTPVVDALVRTTDVLPTLLDALDVEHPTQVDGVSLLDCIEGAQPQALSAFADQLNGYDLNSRIATTLPSEAFLYAVIDAGWKLVYRPAAPERSELFDLVADPGEQRNLRAARPDQFVRLKRLLAAHAPWVASPFPDQEGGSDASSRSALASLGYAEGDSDGAEFAWAWVCPEHTAAVRLDPGACRECGAPPLLVRKL